MKIVCLYNKNSSCSYHRIILPFTNMNLENGDSILLIDSEQNINIELLANADFLIFSRILPYNIEIIKKWKNLFGFKIIIDIDDSWELNVNHSLYNLWKLNKTSESIIESIKFADFVTTTNKILRDKIELLNKNVFIFSNGLPFELGQFSYNPKEHDSINIVYTGGQTHFRDLKTIVPALNKLNYFSDLNFIIAGYDKEDDEFWRKMDCMLSNIKNAFFKEVLPLSNYMDHYNIADFTLAPLETNSFNSYKSNLKIIEAGCKNVPIICSSTDSYLQEKTEGLLIAKNNKDWYDKIKSLYKDSSYRQEIGIILGNYVRENYNLISINKNRYEFFKSII